MIATETIVRCSVCEGRLARDHSGTMCSPCRRTLIERSATHQALIARDRPGIKAAFEAAGVYGVSEYLETTPAQALDAVISSRLFPFVSERRLSMLRRLVEMRNSSHVAVAESLQISRWTVAAYRQQLGIDRLPSSTNGTQ